MEHNTRQHHTHTDTQTDRQTYGQIHTHTHTHTHTLTHTHTHTHTQAHASRNVSRQHAGVQAESTAAAARDAVLALRARRKEEPRTTSLLPEDVTCEAVRVCVLDNPGCV